jgi:hypothetical protein
MSEVSDQSQALVPVAPENELLLGLPVGQEIVNLDGGLGRRGDQKHPGPPWNRTSISNYRNIKLYPIVNNTL